MALSMEDMELIKSELDDRYVMQSDCSDKQETVNKKLANDDKRIELIVQDFNTIKNLVKVVATASIGSLVTSFFELILR